MRVAMRLFACSVLGLLLALTIVAPAAMAASSQTQTGGQQTSWTPPVGDPHHPNSPNPNVGSSRLNHADTIVINAPDGRCYSVTNNSTHDYFVPWNSVPEWNKFVQATQVTGSQLNVTLTPCCPKKTVNDLTPVCGHALPPASNPYVGTRFLGLNPAPDDSNWGGVGDVYTVNASQLLNDPSINFQITYMCKWDGILADDPVWTATNQQGSCTPIDGSCANTSAGFASMPTSQSQLTVMQASLCGSGSVYEQNSMTGGATGPHWTWKCDGTPNRAVASCSANIISSDPTCGTAATQSGNFSSSYLTNPPATYAELCGELGDTSNVIPTPHTENTTTHAKTWIWTCTSGSGVVKWCWTFDPNAPGCGTMWGHVATSLSPNSPNDPALCSKGTVSNFQLSSDGSQWTWQCLQPGDTPGSCNAFKGSPPADATCGTANNTAVSSVPTGSALCSAATTYMAAGPNQVSNSQGTYWTWTCANSNSNYSCATLPSGGGGGGGDDGGSTTTPPGTGACGDAANTRVPYAPTYNLCASGNAGPVTGSGPWTWTCNGANGNATCTAHICDACTGQTSRGQSFGRSGSGGGCNFSGTAQWNENDLLVTDSAFQNSVSWDDSLGHYSRTFAADVAPSNFCQPCYLKTMQNGGVNNAGTQINSANGNCSGVHHGDFVPASGIHISN